MQWFLNMTLFPPTWMETDREVGGGNVFLKVP